MPRTTLRERRRKLWSKHLFSQSAESTERQQSRAQLLETWARDPWAYLCGRDLPDPSDDEWIQLIPEGERDKPWVKAGGRPIIWTVDERDDKWPVKPFPAIVDPEAFQYLEHVTRELWREFPRIKLIDKARQVYITTLCLCNIDWYGTFVEEREVIVSQTKEELAAKLINDRIRTPHSRKPKWLRDMVGLSAHPNTIITYGNTKTTVTAVSQEFATSGARGPTASIILVDEAAFQSAFGEIYRAVLPMSARVWAVTTANIGNPGAQAFRDLIMEGRPGSEREEEEEEENVD